MMEEQKSKQILPKKGLAVCCVALSLSMAAHVTAQDNPADPWEDFNRAVWGFNKTADKYLLKPLAKGYDWITPQPVDDGISNVFNNLGETKNFLNDVFQFKFDEAGIDVARFLVNSTVGVLGIIDVASRWGLESNQEDFGQTLAVWGFNSGPYLVLPLFGPSTVRDGLGLIPDAYSVPQAYIDHNNTKWSVYATDIIDTRADLFGVEKLIQGDEYSFVRDAYLQRREYLVTDGAVEDDFTSDDFEDD